MATIAALLLPTLATGPEPVQTKPQIGDAYEITSGRESSQEPRIETQIEKHIKERPHVSKPAPDWRRTA